MKVSAIYKIQSIINPERIYIGSSQDITGRLKLHFRDLRKNKHHSIKLQRHFNKHGESDLLFSILLGCDKEDLLKVEQYFLDSYKPYFNICLKAGSHLGMKRSPESCERIRNANRGEKHWLFGKHIPEETKVKLRIASMGNQYSKGFKQSDETKKKRAEKLKGHPNYLLKHSEETKRKISESNKGKNGWSKGQVPWNKGKAWSDEVKLKMSNSCKGKKKNPFTEEHKLNISKSKKGVPTWSKGKHQSFEAIEKSRLKRTGAKRTDEMKKAISDACKLAWIKKKTA